MNEYQFVLPYPPSVNTYWRRRGSQYYISDKGQKYRKDVQQIIRQLKLDIFTKSRLRIKVIADVPDSRRRDLDNILKGLLDSLIHAGFAEDDEQFDDIRVIRGVKVPGGRLGIKITELENACKRAARTVLTGMCYSVGSATRQGSSSPTRFIGQSAMTSRT